MIRMLALDLDETTLRADGTLSALTRRAIDAVAEKGVIVVAASGRAFEALPKEVRFCASFRYAITSNGAAIHEMQQGKLLRRLTLSPETIEAILQQVRAEPDILIECGIHGQMYAPEEYIANPVAFQRSPSIAAYIQRTRKPVKEMELFLQQHFHEVDCIDLICPNPIRKQQIAEKIYASVSGIYVTSSVPQLVEIAHAKAGKASGLRFLACRCGISSEQIMACGNADNDADMLSYAGLGVAVANATPSCLAAANAITETYISDGVAKAMIRFILSDNF